MCQARHCELDTEIEQMIADGQNVQHADYPHSPGTLYDCQVCEEVCFCVELNKGQDVEEGDEDATLCVACAIANEEFAAQADAKYGRRS